MTKIIKKNEILTVPNMLSMFRLILIPVIVWLYFFDEEKHYAAFGVIVLSGLTDIIDGKIARKYNMISDLGKILDPVADKFTQGVIFICLSFTYPLLWLLIALFAVKETVSALVGYRAIKKEDTVHSAMWHGKLNTVLLYLLICILLLVPKDFMSNTVADILIICCCVFMSFSFVLYLRFFIHNIKKAKKAENK